MMRTRSGPPTVTTARQRVCALAGRRVRAMLASASEHGARTRHRRHRDANGNEPDPVQRKDLVVVGVAPKDLVGGEIGPVIAHKAPPPETDKRSGEREEESSGGGKATPVSSTSMLVTVAPAAVTVASLV